MSAVVCGKRTFCEDLPSTPPLSKKLRFCSSSTSAIRFSPFSNSSPASYFSVTQPLDHPPSSQTLDHHADTSSPIRFSPFSNSSSAACSPSSQHLGHLADIFPLMDKQLLERVLEECGHDLDSAIKRLHELSLETEKENLGLAVESDGNMETGMVAAGLDAESAENSSSSNSFPVTGAEWVELFVREMASAMNVHDARDRATRALEMLEKTVSARAGVEVTQSDKKEKLMLKQQIEVLIRENTILKRAVAIQHERKKEFDIKNHEMQHLKQLATQYQQQLRTLEVNNYALTMHLKQATQSNSIGHFHPDVF